LSLSEGFLLEKMLNDLSKTKLNCIKKKYYLKIPQLLHWGKMIARRLFLGHITLFQEEQ